MLCSVTMGLTGGSMNEYPSVLLEPREYQLYFLLARTKYIDLKNGFLFSLLGSSTVWYSCWFFFQFFILITETVYNVDKKYYNLQHRTYSIGYLQQC